MGDEATAQARRAALAAYRVDDALLDLARPDAIALHDLPRTPARRSRPRSSTARASGSGIRPRTADTRRRRCSNGCSGLEAAARPAVGDELELRIDSLAFGGAGVARTRGGYVVFVDGGIPRRPRPRPRAPSQARLRAGARRPSCSSRDPIASRRSADHPGAPWQELRYERQLEVKQQQVDDALRRIGHLDGFALEPIVPAGQLWRYRNKLEYSFGRGAGRRARLRLPRARLLGAHRRRSTTACLPRSAANEARRDGARRGAARRALRRSIVATRERLPAQPRRPRGPAHGRAPGSPRDRAGALDGGLARRGARCRRPAVERARTRSPRRPPGGETELLAGIADARRADRRARARDLARRLLPDQHRDGRAALRARRRRRAALRGWERVFDLYCGVGSIGSDARRAAPARSTASRSSPRRVADAIANARRNEIANATFYAGDVRLVLRELVERAGRPDVVVVDPPRAGLSQKVVRRLIEAAPKRIVYVSCNPTTLAPNAAQLAQAGWRLRARHAPSTCSRRRRTSSAWRCSPADDRGDDRRAAQRRAARAPRPAPGAGEVLVRVRAAGLNGADMQPASRAATRPRPACPRTSRASSWPARSRELGPGASRFALGDRVMAIVGGGAQAELAIVHERTLMAVSARRSTGRRPAASPRSSRPPTTRSSRSAALAPGRAAARPRRRGRGRHGRGPARRR